MFFRLSLIILLLSTIVNSKEVLTSDLKPGLIMIKIATSESKHKAENIVKELLNDYDLLTLKDKYFEHYIVNIEPQNYNTTLANIKKDFPSSFYSTKKSFKTTGVILITDITTPIFDLNTSLYELNTTVQETNTSLNESNLTNISQIANDFNHTKITKPLAVKSDNSENITLVNSIKNKELAQKNQEPSYLSKDNQDKETLPSIENKIDLIDAVLQTLSISDKVKASKEKMLQAKYNIDIAYGNYYPSIDATYTTIKTEKRPGNMTPEQTLERAKFFTDEQYSLTLSQNLYAGGETQNEVERLKAQYLVAKTDFERLLEEEIFKAITSYIDVVFTRDSMDISKKNMEELETIFDIVKTKFDAGALSLGELSNIEASVANAKSQFSKTSSKFNNALEYFKFIAGELFQDTYPYEKIVHVTVSPLDNILNKMPEKNSEIKSYNYDIISKKFNLKKLQAPFRPKIDLVLAAEKITDKENFEVIEDGYIAKLLVSYNIFNGEKDKNNYLKAFSSIQEKVFEKEGELRRIKWELEKLHISLTSLQDNLNNVENEVNSSRNMVSSYWESFRNGEQDLHVLLQGQRQLNAAELDFIQSQQNSMKDYFEILKLSGDLLSYFQIDINEPNYLDLAKAKYRARYKPIEQIKNDILAQESPIKKEDINASAITQQISNKKKSETDLMQLLSFHEKFLIENPENYTILIKGLNNPLEGLKKISDLNISNEAFIYEDFENKKIKTKIAFGIYKSYDDANSSIKTTLINSELENISIEKIGTVQNEFKEFSKLLFVDSNNIPKVVIPAKKVIQEEKPFETNQTFKEQFLSAPEGYFTINITTLSSMKVARELLKKENIENNAFVFQFAKSPNWFKLMYGIFATYKEAQSALNTLSTLNASYMPVIEKISLKQELYKRFNAK